MAARPTPLVSSILRNFRTQPTRPSPLNASSTSHLPAPTSSPAATSLLRILATTTSPSSLTPIRAKHSIPGPPRPPKPEWPPRFDDPARPHPPRPTPPSKHIKPNAKPAYYQLTFTCVPCEHRSQHQVSKQAYHHGSTLITCPECRNRHVISDHLGIFGDRKITVEDLMREKGQLVKRGSLGEDGDIEFWVDEKASRNGGKGEGAEGALEATSNKELEEVRDATSHKKLEETNDAVSEKELEEARDVTSQKELEEACDATSHKELGDSTDTDATGHKELGESTDAAKAKEP